MTKGNIRLYNTEAEYLAEKDSFELPNVSFIEDSKVVFYNANLSNSWATMANGVYAVGADGSPVMVEDADESCIGVALIVNDAPTPQKLMITKGYADNMNWGLSEKDVSGITNISTVDGTNSFGWFAGGTPQFSKDYTTWTSGALADFNGKTNTQAIIAAYTEHNVEMDEYDMCSKLKTFNSSDTYSDWYIPALGQLALIYLNITDINKALRNIKGNVMWADEGYYYWSSSEESSDNGWRMYFDSDEVSNAGKFGGAYVKFVRDLI